VFGHGNYGNEATLEAFLGQLDPARFTPLLLTNDAEAAGALHGVAARMVGGPVNGRSGRFGRVANRAGYLAGAFRAVRDCDAIVIAGTGGLEHAGAFGTPFEIWSLALASRILRRPFLLLDIGVDAHTSAAARFFARNAARLAAYRSYRDEQSRDNMAANGFRGNDPVVTDMAFALRPTMSAERDERRVVVGVMAYSDDGAGSGERYTDRCAELVASLLDRGLEVVVAVGDAEDIPAARTVVDRFAGRPVSLSPAKTPSELTALMSSAAGVVATRYHTLILALLARTPVVSIGYSAKHQAMQEQFELPSAHLLSGEFAPGDVVTLVDAMLADASSLQQTIDKGLAQAEDRLAAHWPVVLETITSGRTSGRKGRP
jgi:polysaccharide pyruvyl transferase WcaK-like protein